MKRVSSWLRELWFDEQGDLIQNIGWIVAVSLGALAVGALVYGAIRGYADDVRGRIDGITPGDVTNPDYDL